MLGQNAGQNLIVVQVLAGAPFDVPLKFLQVVECGHREGDLPEY